LTFTGIGVVKTASSPRSEIMFSIVPDSLAISNGTVNRFSSVLSRTAVFCGSPGAVEEEEAVMCCGG
jgi:hypothetical protein